MGNPNDEVVRVQLPPLLKQKPHLTMVLDRNGDSLIDRALAAPQSPELRFYKVTLAINHMRELKPENKTSTPTEIVTPQEIINRALVLAFYYNDEHNSYRQIIEYLFEEEKANPNTLVQKSPGLRNDFGGTALSTAIARDDKKSVSKLLEHKAELHLNINGIPPLRQAVKAGHMSIVNILLTKIKEEKTRTSFAQQNLDSTLFHLSYPPKSIAPDLLKSLAELGVNSQLDSFSECNLLRNLITNHTASTVDVYEIESVKALAQRLEPLFPASQAAL